MPQKAGFSMENVRFMKPGDSHTQIKERKYVLFRHNYAIFCLCKANFLHAQNRIAVFGFYLWRRMKHPATCKEFVCRFHHPYRVIHRQ